MEEVVRNARCFVLPGEAVEWKAGERVEEAREGVLVLGWARCDDGRSEDGSALLLIQVPLEARSWCL